MKQIILSIAISFASIGAIAQTKISLHSANLPWQSGYEAATWKTWLLDNPQQIIRITVRAGTQLILRKKTV